MIGTAPLAVRIFNNWAKSFDLWVTEWISKVQYRSVIPGGFANATITLHANAPDKYAQVVKLYNRVQVIDWKTGEVEWEGRMEAPRRNEDTNSWEIGCLGAMIVASDIRIPWFAVDGKVSNWRPATSTLGDYTAPEVDEVNNTLVYKPRRELWTGPNHWVDIFNWEMAYRCDMRIGRFDATYEGAGPNANFRTGIDIIDNVFNSEDNVDLTAWNAAKVRKGNAVNGASSFTSEEAQNISVAFDYIGSTTMTEGHWGSIIDPRIQAQRVDQYGNKLQNATVDYPNDWVTVPQIIKDVVGRFLVGAYYWSGTTFPYIQKKVRPDDVFIDETATAKITHLTFYDGVTAAEIFDACMNAQPDQYWAIWESALRADSDDIEKWGFSFEWRNWDTFWSYRATTIDGIEEQPDGEEPYNGIFMQHSRDDSPAQKYANLQWRANTPESNPALDAVWLNRVQTVIKEEPLPVANITDTAKAELDKISQTRNTGKIRISRPIHCYDPGTNGRQGMNRMVPPHKIRPGRLILITDLPMEARLDNPFTAFQKEQQSAVFRMVGCTFDSDGYVDVDLDQVTAWNNANQIIRGPQIKGKVVVKG